MPITNYCKKCACEVPAGAACPYCGGKLAGTGERLSFVYTRVPVRDGYAWRGLLRVILPAFALLGAAVLLIEFCVNGYVGFQVMLRERFPLVLAASFAGVLAVAYLFLCAQGAERVHYVLDKEMARAYVYLERPTPLRLFSRLITRESLRGLQEEAPEGVGALLIQVRCVPWALVRRVQFLDDTRKVLLYKPRAWLTMPIHCPVSEYDAARGFARKKLSRLPEVKEIAAEERRLAKAQTPKKPRAARKSTNPPPDFPPQTGA